ncbi:MAG: ATPase [Bacteroidales bacterium]|nr:ATPase [Bacteroidales bacterium]
MNSGGNPPTLSRKEKLRRIYRAIYFILALAGILGLIYDTGINRSYRVIEFLYWVFHLSLVTGIVFIILIYLSRKTRPKRKVWAVDAFLLLFFSFLIIDLLGLSDVEFFSIRIWLNTALVINFIRSLAAIRLDLKGRYLNPARLFILSFLIIIFLGTVLLMLPNATYHGISFLDALFTSTSSVCVTGLIVVDTGEYFTRFGQTIMLVLIQAGGIGIMTFTSYFGFFFKGGSSYQNRLMMQDMNNDEKTAEVFNTLKKIILVTFVIEGVGAALIYTSILSNPSATTGGNVFFSIFHSVSGFCNAGFSTLTQSLYDPAFRYNYPLHLILAFLFIIGGLGFPIVFNTLTYLRYLFIDRLLRRTSNYQPWLIGINTRLVVITTFILLGSSTLLFFSFEYNNTLAEHGFIGKIVTAFFSAATPRTAGFNMVDMSALHFPTTMLILLLMWIGASPASTGGGVKTSTFAIAVLNFVSIAKGKDRIEVFKREISSMSIRRAFAIISLSILVIGTSVMLLVYFDGNKGLLPLAFESFSAFSTVGLSLGITESLSSAGKVVIIFTMFIGRVSMLTILVAFMRRLINLKYKYPTEEILIN